MKAKIGTTNCESSDVEKIRVQGLPSVLLPNEKRRIFVTRQDLNFKRNTFEKKNEIRVAD